MIGRVSAEAVSDLLIILGVVSAVRGHLDSQQTMFSQEFWLKLSKRIHKGAKKLVYSLSDAQDLAQIVMLELWKRSNKDPNLKSEGDWQRFSYKVLRNRAINFNRYKQRRREVPLDPLTDERLADNTVKAGANEQLISLIAEVVSELKEEERELLKMLVDQTPNEEICRKLGITNYNTFQTKKHRLVQKLKKLHEKKEKRHKLLY